MQDAVLVMKIPSGLCSRASDSCRSCCSASLRSVMSCTVPYSSTMALLSSRMAAPRAMIQTASPPGVTTSASHS
ncbi:hypothetical protein D3C80_1088190 [compost metagenome]